MLRNVLTYLSIIIPAIILAGAGLSCAYGELVWDGKQWIEPEIPDAGTVGGDLIMIRKMVEMNQNDGIVDLVEIFLVDHYDSPACEEAINLAGQSLLNLGHYWDAYQWFERQINDYPNGIFYYRALDREYHIADAFLNGRKRKFWKIFRISAEDEGIEMLIQIAARTPAMDVGETSLLRIADYYFDETQYQDSIDFYDRFMEGYPDSSKRSYAMYRAAEACLLDFRGMRYDKTPLLRSKLRFRTFAAAFPRESRQKGVNRILSEIDSSLAKKLYHTGAFYERVKRSGAAVYYYKRVIREYGSTEWADTSRTRIMEIGPIDEEEVMPPVREGDVLKQEPEPSTSVGDKLIPVEEIPKKRKDTETVSEKNDKKVGEKEVQPLSLEDILKLREKGKRNDQ